MPFLNLLFLFLSVSNVVWVSQKYSRLLINVWIPLGFLTPENSTTQCSGIPKIALYSYGCWCAHISCSSSRQPRVVIFTISVFLEKAKCDLEKKKRRDISSEPVGSKQRLSFVFSLYRRYSGTCYCSFVPFVIVRLSFLLLNMTEFHFEMQTCP